MLRWPISLQRPGVVTLGRQRKAAGVPQHVRMGFEIELTGTLDHTGKPRHGEPYFLIHTSYGT
jgi:hypothetical protein